MVRMTVTDLALDLHALIHTCVKRRVVRLGTQDMLLCWVNDSNVTIRAWCYEALLRVQVEDLGSFGAAEAHKV